MNKYDKILEAYHKSILESCGSDHKKKKKMTEEEDEKNSKEYKDYFNKIAKKMGIDPENIENLSAEKKKKFFDAVDKGWKADKETDIDEATAVALDDVIGNANQLMVQLKNLVKKKKDKKVEKAVSVLGDIMKTIKTTHFKESAGFGGANFTTPAQEMALAINELERLMNNFKQRGGDFKTKVPALKKAYDILYKASLGR